MKIKINNLLTKQRESDEKIKGLEETVDRLFAENVKMNADMKILRDEHTEVLHAMFQQQRNTSQLNQENNTIKNILNNSYQGFDNNLTEHAEAPNNILTNLSTRDGGYRGPSIPASVGSSMPQSNTQTHENLPSQITGRSYPI